MLDGGKCGTEKDFSLPITTRRYLMFKVELIKKIDTSLLTTDTERLTSNSMSSMLMNGRENQPRDNSHQIMVSTLTEPSTLFQE
jgi:hypothetical protein